MCWVSGLSLSYMSILDDFFFYPFKLFLFSAARSLCVQLLSAYVLSFPLRTFLQRDGQVRIAIYLTCFGDRVILCIPSWPQTPNPPTSAFPRAEVTGLHHQMQFYLVLRLEPRASSYRSTTDSPSQTSVKYFSGAWEQIPVWNPRTPDAEAG